VVQLAHSPFVSYGPLEGVTDTAVQSIAEGAGGAVWIGAHAASVTRLRPEGVDRFPLPSVPGRDGVIALHGDRRGGTWVSQDSGRLFRIEDGQVTGVLAKLDARDRAHAVLLALDRGLVDVSNLTRDPRTGSR
jgi:streptogramin lyase